MSRTTKTTRKTAPQATPAQRKTVANIESATLTAMIDQRKNEMMRVAIGEGSYILGGYWNWFSQQINTAEDHAKGDHSDSPPHVQSNLNNDARAWKRARDLFFIAAPVALAELRELVTAQIKKEFEPVDRITAADVCANLRGVTHGELLREAMYAPFDVDAE